jgi:hypothetical protein
MKYNKIVWSYWEGSMDNITKKCIDSWYKYIPNGWKIVILNNSKLNEVELIKPFRFNKLSHTTKSDVIRLSVLYKYGGLWMDASVLLTQKLDWIQNYEKNDYYGFNYDSRNYIESWFLYVPNMYNHNILNWLNVFNSILNTQPYTKHIAYKHKCTDNDDYFMIYQAFCYLVNVNSEFKDDFNKLGKNNASKYFYNPMKPIRRHDKLIKFIKTGRKLYKYCRFPLIYVYILLLLLIFVLIFIRIKYHKN